MSRAELTCRDLRLLQRLTKAAGVTLVELMVSITIGLLIVMAATALLITTKSGYTSQDENVQIQQTGRYAIELIGRTVRQTAYENWDRSEAPIVNTDVISPAIRGLDARRLKETDNGLDKPASDAVNGSDVLAVRYFGSGQNSDADGTVLNCAGFGVAPAQSQREADDARGWSIFYVAKNASGEPELYCKYKGAEGEWQTDAIARGVEAFQVLYGLDANADGLPDRFLNATSIDDLDRSIAVDGADEAAIALDRNRKTHWKKVIVVQVALLVRGSIGMPTLSDTEEFNLFGKEYANAYGAADKGTRIKAAALPARHRKLFMTVIQLRNRATGGGA
jgi:type IV pilus assembly protein PilW